MKKIIVLLALTGITCCTLAQDVNKFISQDDVYRIIKTLSADDMQGRGTFTPGIEKAARFIESEYKQTGLQPMPGDSGSYRQNFYLYRAKTVKLVASVNGQAVAPENVFATTGSSFNWANNPDVQVEVLSSDKDFRQEYSAYRASHKKQLVLVDPAFAPIFKRLYDISGKGKVSATPDTSAAIMFVLGKFDHVNSFNIACTVEVKQLPLFNIVGILPGKTKPDEYVVFSGHYDHLGILKPVKGDSIANGADDDASGTTAVLTLAKYFKKLNNNARTLVFVAFTAEEIGELGSQHFAITVDPDKVVAMFNIEMIGKPSKFGQNSAFITGFERSDFGPILQKNLQGTVFKFYPDPYPTQNLFYRSDNASLAKQGVPAHTISTDQIDTDTLYHTVGDELSTLDVANIVSTIRAIALSSRTIVSGEDTPTRVPKLTK